jgi:hypothetical protein
MYGGVMVIQKIVIADIAITETGIWIVGLLDSEFRSD